MALLFRMPAHYLVPLGRQPAFFVSNRGQRACAGNSLSTVEQYISRIGVRVLRSEHIAVVGAGLMGHAIAQIFAVKGHEVILFDTDAKAVTDAIIRIRSNLSVLSEHGCGLQEEIDRTIDRIKPADNLKEAVAGARFVVEAVTENLEVKQNLFQEMEVYCSPITILATNTSVIGISQIAAKTKAKERVVGTHFWNPPYLIPLVEVTGGSDTLTEVKYYTCNLLKSMGMHPVLVKKDVPGFVGNRLQHALWREAIAIVEYGIADPETVDEVIKKGFGIQLSVQGPLEKADMEGLDLTFMIQSNILKFMECSPSPSAFLSQKLKSGELGFKTRQGFYSWDEERIWKYREDIVKHLVRWNRESGSE